MNVKCILIGAIVFLIVTNILGMAVSGPLIHEGILDPIYQEHETFWRPELREDPPDMAALMPMWILNGFIVSLIVAWLYCMFRRCCAGAEWKRGMMFCIYLAIFGCGMMLAWSGVFALPAKLWLWWAVDTLVIYAIGGAGMGWAVGKWGGIEGGG